VQRKLPKHKLRRGHRLRLRRHPQVQAGHCPFPAQRAPWVSGQSFDSNGGELKITKETLEFAKNDIKELRNQEIKKSHELPDNELRVNGGTVLNCSNVRKEWLAETHAQSIIADPKTYRGNLRAARQAGLLVCPSSPALLLNF
jgi:hypothetical protein